VILAPRTWHHLKLQAIRRHGVLPKPQPPIKKENSTLFRGVAKTTLCQHVTNTHLHAALVVKDIYLVRIIPRFL